jgi:outer membrane cobalamin receptor
MFNTKFIILISIIITLGYIFRNKLKDIYNDTTIKIKNMIQNNDIEFVSNENLKKELSRNITNLFNTDYVEIEKYTTRGRNFVLGLNYRFP